MVIVGRRRIIRDEADLTLDVTLVPTMSNAVAGLALTRSTGAFALDRPRGALVGSVEAGSRRFSFI